MHERQAFAPAEVRIAEFVLIEAELVQDRRVDVAQMAAILDGAQADVVGGADDRAPFDAAAGEPHREAEVVMIASPAALRFRRSAELAAPQHQRRIEQAAAVSGRSGERRRLIGLPGHA